MWLALVLALALALASVISYDHKWCCNLERHLLTALASSFTIVLCLWYRPLYFFLCVYSFVLHSACLFICPSFCMFIYLPVLLTLFYVRTSTCVFLYTYIISISLSPSVCTSMYLNIHIYSCMYLSLCLCFCIFLSVCLSKVHLSIFSFVYLFICLSACLYRTTILFSCVSVNKKVDNSTIYFTV